MSVFTDEWIYLLDFSFRLFLNTETKVAGTGQQQ